MLKDVQDLIESKNKEIEKLQDTVEQLTTKRSAIENQVSEMEKMEKEAKQQLAELQESQSEFSVDVILNDWIKHMDQYDAENIKPLMDKVKANKKDYLESVNELVQSVESLEQERKQLMSLLNSNGVTGAELNQFNTRRYRFEGVRLDDFDVSKDESIERLAFLMGR